MIVSAAVSPPSWLAGHVIQAADERALDEKFAAHLVKVDEIFKKLQAVPELFGTLAAGLKPQELSRF